MFTAATTRESMRAALAYHFDVTTLAEMESLIRNEAYVLRRPISSAKALRRAKKAICALYTGRYQIISAEDAFGRIDDSFPYGGTPAR